MIKDLSFPCDLQYKYLHLQCRHILLSVSEWGSCLLWHFMSSRVSGSCSHILFSPTAASCPCLLAISHSFLFYGQLNKPKWNMRPGPGASHHCLLSTERLSNNESRISQANAITRSVSQFGFRMNCGNELWKVGWSVQTGMTQYCTHFPSRTWPHHLVLGLQREVSEPFESCL